MAKWVPLTIAAPRLGKSVLALQKYLQRAAKTAKLDPDGKLRVHLGAAAVATRIGRNWLVCIEIPAELQGAVR